MAFDPSIGSSWRPPESQEFNNRGQKAKAYADAQAGVRTLFGERFVPGALVADSETGYIISLRGDSVPSKEPGYHSIGDGINRLFRNLFVAIFGDKQRSSADRRKANEGEKSEAAELKPVPASSPDAPPLSAGDNVKVER